MTIYGLDPGTAQSALVLFDGRKVLSAVTAPNERINERLRARTNRQLGDTLIVEQMSCFGMPVGEEIFTTVWWSGRFAETWLRESRDFARFGQLKRQSVKLHLCGNTRAKDANIRQALIDRFGPGRAQAIGVKARRGPLYGISGDCWSALAVAVTWWDQSQPATPVARTASAR